MKFLFTNYLLLWASLLFFCISVLVMLFDYDTGGGVGKVGNVNLTFDGNELYDK